MGSKISPKMRERWLHYVQDVLENEGNAPQQAKSTDKAAEAKK